jgi:predicted transposase/invertase (TIGR01784 family)
LGGAYESQHFGTIVRLIVLRAIFPGGEDKSPDAFRRVGERGKLSAILKWIKALLLRRATTPMIEEVSAIQDVFEEFEMLTQHRETWFDDEIEQSYLQGQEKGLEKGREEGREEERRSVARNLINLGQPVDVVVQVTGLSREVVQSLLQ